MAHLILLMMMYAKPARLVVPQECVDKIELVYPMVLDENGNVYGKPVFRIRFHCTKVENKFQPPPEIKKDETCNCAKICERHKSCNVKQCNEGK
jgi:hypothetical protein